MLLPEMKSDLMSSVTQNPNKKLGPQKDPTPPEDEATVPDEDALGEEDGNFDDVPEVELEEFGSEFKGSGEP